MLQRVSALDEDQVRPAADAAAQDAATPSTLEQFLAEVGPRAFRFAELGLRQREDALDAVQDAMEKMLGYRDRPVSEWPPLFWRILRSRIVDVQRRRTFRLRWLAPPPEREDGGLPDWTDEGPGPARVHEGQEAYARLSEAIARLPARQREAFTLRVLEELDVATTAEVMGLLGSGGLPKGDALAVARVAGIMAAKKTPELIPLCHPLPLSKVTVDFELAADSVSILATVKTRGVTGVEMEALTAASVAALSVYDMVKAVDKHAVLTDIKVLAKSGGKSGDWTL